MLSDVNEMSASDISNERNAEVDSNEGQASSMIPTENHINNGDISIQAPVEVTGYTFVKRVLVVAFGLLILGAGITLRLLHSPQYSVVHQNSVNLTANLSPMYPSTIGDMNFMIVKPTGTPALMSSIPGNYSPNRMTSSHRPLTEMSQTAVLTSAPFITHSVNFNTLAGDKYSPSTVSVGTRLSTSLSR